MEDVRRTVFDGRIISNKTDPLKRILLLVRCDAPSHEINKNAVAQGATA